MKYINNYFIEQGIDSTNARSGETFPYIIGECGYLHLENFDSTVADRLYNSFGSEGVKKAIVIVDNKPNLIAADYANRRYISIVDANTISDNVADKQIVEESQPETKVDSNVQQPKSIIEPKRSSEPTLEANAQKSTPSQEKVDQVLERINSEIDELELETAIENRFNEEVPERAAANKTSGENTVAAKQSSEPTNVNRKNSKTKTTIAAKFGYTIVIMLLLVFISNTIENAKDGIQFEEVYTSVVDPDYVFKWDDLKTNNSSGGEVLVNLEQIELGSGSNYQVNQENLQFSQSESELDSELFTVGEDIEPGIYTLKYSGDIGVYVENELNISLFNQDVDYYNIPLGIGSTVEIVRPNFAVGDDYSIELTPQNELVNYEDGLYGLFIYGLTYFDSDLTIDSDEYSVVYTYPYSEFESIFETYSFDSKVSLQGYPGSYISIS